MTDVRQKIVAAMAGEIGPGDVEKYWRSCGVPAPYPPHWCGAIALWALHEAGVAQHVMWKIGLGFCEVHGLKRTRNPQPGDIAYTDKPWQHHAVVESLVDGVLTTIDGNQPDVRRKTRRLPKSGIVFYSIDKFLSGAGPSDEPIPDTDPAPTTPSAKPELARGIDVSHHQTPTAINWPVVARDHKFAIARASYGFKPDVKFPEHISRARAAGMTVGAYHFFRAGQAAEEQAEVFLEAVQDVYCPGCILPVVDIEQNPEFDGPVSMERYATALRFCELVEAEYHGVMIYTNPSMWTQIGNPRWITERRLWISHYGVDVPRTPFNMDWDLWQYEVGRIRGYAGPIDRNVAKTLPLVPEHHSSVAFELLPLTIDWEQLREERDALIRDDL